MKRLLTTEQAAELLNTTPINIRKLVFKKRIKSEYPGKGLFDPKEIERFKKTPPPKMGRPAQKESKQ